MHQPISKMVLFKKYEINFACPIVTSICGKRDKFKLREGIYILVMS